MQIKPKDIYRGRRKYRTLVTVVLFVAVLLIICALILFYALQKYIVYGQDGISLHLPFMEQEEQAEEVIEPEAEPRTSTDVVAEIVVESPAFDEVDTDAGQNLTAVKALYVPADELDPVSLAVYASQASDDYINALILEMKPESGQLSWKSGVGDTAAFGTSGTEDLTETISSLKSKGVYLVAQLSCFADEMMATRNLPITITDSNGNVYTDSSGNCWLDPYNKASRQYIIDLITEIEAMGFDEVLLTNFMHPVAATALTYSQDMSYAMDVVSCISSNALKIKEAFEESDIRISVLADNSSLRNGLEAQSGQDLNFFYKVFDRIYCYTTADYIGTDSGALSEAMETGDFSLRFVPIMSESPGLPCWVIR